MMLPFQEMSRWFSWHFMCPAVQLDGDKSPSTCHSTSLRASKWQFHDLLQPGMVSSVGASSPTEADIAAREPGDETSRVLLDGLDPWVSGPLVEIEDDWTYEYHGGYITYIYIIYLHMIFWGFSTGVTMSMTSYDILWHPHDEWDVDLQDPPKSDAPQSPSNNHPITTNNHYR